MNQAASPSQIGTESIQIGVPGTKTSGNTIRSAPIPAASPTRSTTLAVVASRSISTYAACTAAAVNDPITVTSCEPSGYPRSSWCGPGAEPGAQRRLTSSTSTSIGRNPIRSLMATMWSLVSAFCVVTSRRSVRAAWTARRLTAFVASPSP